MQGYFDESADNDTYYVLGGCIATAEAWERFIPHWEVLLPLTRGVTNGKRRFKMKEMTHERDMENVPRFYQAIEDHAIAFVSVTVNRSELRRVKQNVFAPNVRKFKWGRHKPWFVCFRGLMDCLHAQRKEWAQYFPLDQTIDFWFDNRGEKKFILNEWDDYLATRPPEHRKYFGATPRFENEEDFIPLQAAYLWAWWVRKWRLDGTPELIKTAGYPTLRQKIGTKAPVILTLNMTEPQLTEVFKGILKESYPRQQVWHWQGFTFNHGASSSSEGRP